MAALPIIAAVVTAIGTIGQGRQAKAAADAQANAAEYNARIDQARASRALEVSGIQEERQRQQARAVIGGQLASSAGAGAGLNVDLLRQSLFNVESDAGDIRYEGAIKGAGLSDQATLALANAQTLRQQGRAARNAGYLSAAGSLLSAGAKYGGGGTSISPGDGLSQGDRRKIGVY